MQKLILPMDACVLNASYKHPNYKKKWGFTHYGVDLTAGVGNVLNGKTENPNACQSKDFAVRACGNGCVHSCGLDGYTTEQGMGYAVVVVYQDVQLQNGKRMDLACRMCHFERLNIQAGQRVTTDTILGWYGKTGQYVDGAHLHMEFDTDTTWPAHTFGISASGKVIKRGTLDSTIDPCTVLFVGEGQRFSSYQGWMDHLAVNGCDLDLSRL